VEQQLKKCKEVERLVDIRVIEADFYSERYSICPKFSTPKKNITIRVVTDLRKLNLLLKLVL
jgi:hypothetical protein